MYQCLVRSLDVSFIASESKRFEDIFTYLIFADLPKFVVSTSTAASTFLTVLMGSYGGEHRKWDAYRTVSISRHHFNGSSLWMKNDWNEL